MTFQVKWAARAEQNLARIWLAAPDRQVVTDAARSLENTLRDLGPAVGESRTAGRRIAFTAPLAIPFVIRAPRTVSVLYVWSCRTHPQS